ncbi:MAG: ATP-binding protein [Promethearchaeota archaeon]
MYILREQNYWFKQPLFDYIDRKTYLKEIKKHINTKSILVIQGPRRAGKTVLLKLLIREMVKSIDKNKILYVNLEDYRLFQHYSLELIEAIYDTYREKINPDKEVYYFIDEIQNIEGFEHYLRSQYDSEKKIKFIITGSNSKLLSKELATLLTGRTLTFEVFPFSFKEYLSYKDMEISDNKYYSLEPNIHKLKHSRIY